jgi:hypothetical protein
VYCCEGGRGKGSQCTIHTNKSVDTGEQIFDTLQSAQKKMAGLWQCTAPKPFEIGTPNFLGILGDT